MMQNSKTAVLIVAAGRGERMGGALPKQYRQLAGVPVLRHSLVKLWAARFCNQIRVVIDPDHEKLYMESAYNLGIGPPVFGGATRQASVHAGLKALEAFSPDYVIIHDSARPLASLELFEAVRTKLSTAQGAIAACAISDSLKKSCDGAMIESSIAREHIYAAQTPQAFHFKTLLAAHEAAIDQNRTDFTDDAALLEWQGHAVALVEGSTDNMKLTLPDDFLRAERLLSKGSPRSAMGYDVHAFAERGDHVMLGGVAVPHSCGVEAHSDGDVVLHALCDAIFGLLGDGDIGTHFPPSDPQWHNAPSQIFVDYAMQKFHARGGRLIHCDITLIAEAPRIGPYREKMMASIAAMTGLNLSSIGLKATTSEGLGFTGRGEGLAAYVTISAELP